MPELIEDILTAYQTWIDIKEGREKGDRKAAAREVMKAVRALWAADQALNDVRQ